MSVKLVHFLTVGKYICPLFLLNKTFLKLLLIREAVPVVVAVVLVSVVPLESSNVCMLT